MNRKLLTSIAAALALLLVGPVWADGEDDELEMTMEVIDNPDEITDGFILVIGRVDDEGDLAERDGEDSGFALR